MEIRRILNPIIQNAIFFIFQIIIINAPIWIYWITQYSPYIRLYTILSLPITFFIAYILAVLVSLIPKCKVLMYIGTYILSILEIYLILNFGTRFSHSIFQLIAETTLNEVNDFLTTYFITPKVFLYIIIVTFFVGINVYSEKSQYIRNIATRCVHFFINRFSMVLLTIILLCGTISIYRDIRLIYCFFAYPYNEVPTKLNSYQYQTIFTTFGKIVFAAYMHNSTSKDTEKLAKTLMEISNVSSSFTSKNIILVLGESFNKYHSSLYGYTKPTNLSLEKERNNLYIMTDVVSPHNATSKCLRKLFSFSNQDNNLYWAETPLFPALYKASGYNVIFISNQESKEFSDNIWDSMNNCLVNDLTIPYLYDYINSSIYKFDMDLVREYKNIRTMAEENQPKLVIFHLIGQHSDYKERYPETDIVFTQKDYLTRKDLNDAQKNDVAHYDNATNYNDKVIGSIIDVFRNEDAIVIYFSDHSDEVYDYRDYMGRSHEPIISKGRAMHQYEVPFMIWVSDKYKKTHPDIIKKIENSVNRPYMTDDLPHLMLELAGIKSEWFEPSRSLINDQYNINRKRLLEDSKQDYDEIMNLKY